MTEHPINHIVFIGRSSSGYSIHIFWKFHQIFTAMEVTPFRLYELSIFYVPLYDDDATDCVSAHVSDAGGK
jgi:hypothetical protein